MRAFYGVRPLAGYALNAWLYAGYLRFLGAARLGGEWAFLDEFAPWGLALSGCDLLTMRTFALGLLLGALLRVR